MDFLSIIKSKIIERKNIENIVSSLKKKTKKIVLTNGCFDILHIGHLTYLAEAKSFGNILIVAINTDDSVRRLKGETRPINNEYARAFSLAALSFVDFVCSFEEDTPENIIKLISPDVLVKGGGYTIDTIVGADFVLKNNGKVEILPMINGFSTTKIIEKLKQ